MDCSELIDLFNKVDGVLICDYNKNIVFVEKTKLKCDIKSTDYHKLERLEYDFVFSPYDVDHLENKSITNEQLISSDIKLKNYYMKNNEYGFKIKFL